MSEHTKGHFVAEGSVAGGSFVPDQRLPTVPGLFTEEGGAHVIGSRCRSCNTPYFPRAAVCRNPDCAGTDMAECNYGGSGVLWSYSTADFAPPPPHKFDLPFKPYLIGVVDLDNGLRLVGQICGPTEGIKVGAKVVLVIEELYREGESARTTWKFKLV